ncbi:MAG: hypothetical protein M9909_03130 [Thermomicrobiales bacterium]|nr:hypothetical protein [Thermomicrobiales bacterium]
MTANTAKVQLCSAISSASGESPFGSAWHDRRFIFVEIPLPWKEPLFDSRNVPPELHDVLKELWHRDIYPAILGFASDDSWTVANYTRVLEYRISEEAFSSFDIREYLLPTHRVAELMELFLLDKHGDSLEAFRQRDVPGRRDYMVCTNGAVDACCARFGYPIYKMLRMMADNPEHNMRVWRCTHFGGHRFAGTMVEMPSGRYWGHLDARDMGPIVRRELPNELIRTRYRGWAAIPSGAVQLAECELFALAGWDWTDALVRPGVAPPFDWDNPAVEPQTVSFTYRHEGQGIEGFVDVVVTPNGTVSTAEDSGPTIEMYDAPQFIAAVVSTSAPQFFRLDKL